MNTINFEFIDESEIEYCNTHKMKKTSSLFDSPNSERHYWGNDAGTELAMALARIEIRKSIKKGIIIDINDHDLTRRLLQKYREELNFYQLEMISVLLNESNVVVVHKGKGEWVIEKK
jgi:hypothetical protein